MEAGRRHRRWWLIAVVAATLGWFLGAYLPAVSNVWVALNVLTPAGQPSAAALPLAYPAVGVDPHTVVSLLGLLLMIGASVRWLTYLQKAEREIMPAAGAGTQGAASVQSGGTTIAARPTSERPVS